MTLYILGALTILVPLVLVVWLSFGTVRSKLEWLLRFLLVGTVVLIFYRSGVWTVTSYYLRFSIIALFMVSAVYSFLKIRTGCWYVSETQWGRVGGTALLALLGVTLNVLTFSGAHYPDRRVSLKFPFTQGEYCVIQGGSNVMTNPFHSMSPNGKYAIDIVEINTLGNRAASIFPTSLTQYQIFGEVVRSPCKGHVVSAVSGLPDNLPPKVDREHSAGNHIVIECGEFKVMLAHLKESSIRISNGEIVKEGQPVGEVGNSGYSDEPHLHMQANSLDGEPIAIMFGDRFLSTNNLYVAR